MVNKNTTKESLIESEKKLERNLGNIIKELGGISFKFVPLFISGIPDRICLLPGGRIFFAEIKTTKKKPEKLQLFWHKKLRNLGFKVWVIDTSEHLAQIKTEYA